MRLVEIQQRELLHCFDNSWRKMMELTKDEPQKVLDRYKLVHAFVTNAEGRRFPHGWLELNDKVIDCARSIDDPLLMDANKYRDTMNAENIIEYTPVEAMIKAAREGNLGPWDASLLEKSINSI